MDCWARDCRAEKPTCSPRSTAGSGWISGSAGFLVLGRGSVRSSLASRPSSRMGTARPTSGAGDVKCRPRASGSSASGRTSGSSSTQANPPLTSTVRAVGATLGGGFAVARSGLGIDRFGNMMWAGSSYATRAPSRVADPGGRGSSMQLDINPMWVGAFTFPNATRKRSYCPPSPARSGHTWSPTVATSSRSPCHGPPGAFARPRVPAARRGSRATRPSRCDPGHRVALADRDRLILQGVEVDRHRERRADLVLAPVTPADGSRVVEVDVPALPQIGRHARARRVRTGSPATGAARPPSPEPDAGRAAAPCACRPHLSCSGASSTAYASSRKRA